MREKLAALGKFVFVLGFGVSCFLLGKNLEATINLAFSPPRIILSQRPNLPYESFVINKDGSNISGWILRGEKEIAIIFAPGYGGHKALFIPLAEFFAQKGFWCVLFDPRGQGESEGQNYALGAFEDEDIEAIMDYVERSYPITHFVLFGFSAGATASIIVSAKNQERVVATIADSPFANLIKIHGNNLFKIAWTYLCNFYGRITRGVDLYQETNALNWIKKVSRIMFIHGMEDSVVPYSNSLLLYKEAREPKEIWLVDREGHVEVTKHRTQEYLNRTLNFIEKCLRSRGLEKPLVLITC